MKRLAVIGALAALAAAGSGVGLSSAAFTAKSRSTATFGAASDWGAPGVSVISPADGALLRSGSVTVGGAAGTDDGDSANISLSLFSGSDATGSPVLTRTASRFGGYWYTSLTSLGDGTYTLLATQSDDAGNTGRATRTFTIDTTAPTRVSVKAENGSGSSGRLDAGDTITFTYSEAIDPDSVLPGWSGTSGATVKVRFLNNVATGTDGFTVLDSGSAANVRLDAPNTSGAGVTLGSGANYVSGTVNFTGTMTRSADGRSFLIVLGSNDSPSRVSTSQASSAKLTWTPKSGPTDLAGNGLANTNSWTESASARHF